MPRHRGPDDRSPPSASTAAPDGPRIIGGSLRGRRLAHRPGGPTRPMKDRVRETLFDLLGDRVAGTIAIDLFAGTGSLGFEALSRGAARAIFVERHFPTADVIRRSARDLGLADRADVKPGDVLAWGRRLPPLPLDAPWIAFLSPPWPLLGERPSEVVAVVAAILERAPPTSLCVLESDGGFDATGLPGGGWESRPVPPAVLHVRGRLVS